MYRTAPGPIVLAVGLLVGCAHKDGAPVTYDPPACLNDVSADLAAAESSVPPDGYRILTNEATAGRFACDVAVARFGRQTVGDGTTVQLVAPTPAEQAYWAQRFRGVRQVRALTFLTPKTVRLDGDSVEALCAAAAELGAPLLIVYARSVTGPNAANVVGVVYRTSDAAVLATMRSQGEGPATLGEDDKLLDDTPGDHRDVDERFQVQRRFEDHAFACIRDLVHADRPAPSTQPHDWQQPFVERWWMRARR